MTYNLFLNSCVKFLNLPYIWGGDDFTGYDCSGLVQELLAMIGLDPAGDQTAQALYAHFSKPEFHELIYFTPKVEKFETGTLIFYGQSLSKITHIGLILDKKTMIEAGGGGSRTTSPESAALANAFVRLRPFDRRKDFVAAIQPKGLPWL